MYYNIEQNKKIASSVQFRELFPNISFPKILTDEIMEDYGYKKVIVNEVKSTIFTKVVDGEIEVIEGTPTINQTLAYKPFYECKDIAMAHIKTNREESIIEPINNVQVAKLEDRENIQGAIQYFDTLSQEGTTIKWTMADNTEKELSLQDLQGVLDSYAIRKAQSFATYQTKKQEIEASTTVEQLESIV